jgi:16S rRNA (guanine527-N7)-methyltransferase
MPDPHSMQRITNEAIARSIAPYGVQIDEELAAKIRQYIELLLRWNAKINLTSVVRPLEIVERHFGEAFFAAKAVPIQNGRLADIGSGAGFPGLALKLLAPGLSVILIESNIKKCVFMQEVVGAINIQGVDIIHARFESVVPSEPFDYVTSRAVGQFAQLEHWASRWAQKSGTIILFVGIGDSEEIRRDAGWNWRSPIKIPRSRERVILVGRPVIP